MLPRFLARIRSSWQLRLFTGPYSLLVFLLVGMYVSIGLFPQGTSLLSDILLISVVLITLDTLVVSRRLRIFYISIASSAFGVKLLYYWASRLELPLETSAQLILATIWTIFFGLSIVLVIQSIYGVQKVTLDTVMGGICVFLMLGYFWYLIFAILMILNPNAFTGPDGIPDNFDLIYFSFTTLTSLGYGEFTPVSRMAKVTSNLEAVCGVLYPAIFIARLVNDYQRR